MSFYLHADIYYGASDFPADLNDRFELKARGYNPAEFCRTRFNCWGQIQLTDNPNAGSALTPLSAPGGLHLLAEVEPSLHLSATAPEDRITSLDLSAELPWPNLITGDPLRLWVRLHGATSLAASNWTEGVKIQLVRLDATGARQTVLSPADWSAKLQPAGFDNAVLGITNATLIREWLAPAAAAQLMPGKYVMEAAWDGSKLAPGSALPADGMLTIPAIEFEVQAPTTDALLALHHRHLAWAAWVTGDDAGVVEHAREAARLDPGAADSLSSAIQFLSATAALRLGNAFGAAQIMSDLQHRLADRSEDLGELAAARLELLAPRLSVVETTAPNRAARLQIEGLNGSTYVLQRSVNLKDWTTINTQVLAGMSALVDDPGLPAGAARFYRVLWTK